MSKEIEEWKDIPGYEGLYQVSDWGRVKSLNYNHTGSPRIMVQAKNTVDRLFVQLSKGGVTKKIQTHKLVALAFLPNPNNHKVIHHIDGNHLNNRVENLMWIDEEEHNKLHSDEKIKNGKPVYQYTSTGEFIREWILVKECAESGYNRACIYDCCNGKRKRHKGYIWSYIKL